ncbi:Fc.00g010830.m01.CDS01 [Cosmosporella sp. VM-42]
MEGERQHVIAGTQSQQVRRPSVDEMNSSNGLDLKFVNMSHPEDIRRQKAVRTEIRRHVMKGIGQQRRRPRATKATPPVMQGSSETVNKSQYSSPRALSSNRAVPARSLPALGSFPVQADMRVLELVHFGNSPSHSYQPFRRVWFEVALCDPGAFHVTLGNAAALWANLKTNSSSPWDPEVSNHYALSVKYLRNRLSNVAESITEGAIANILAHICLNMRHDDWDSWKVHMDGLSLVWRLRGGFDDLDHRIHTLLFMYDLAGAMVFDSIPRFPVPPDILVASKKSHRELPFRLQVLLVQYEQMSPDMGLASQALRMVSAITDVVNLNSQSVSFWQRDIGAITLIGPCIHFLLSIPRLPGDLESQANSESLVAREMVRLSCLLVMSRLKEVFTLFATERAALETRMSQFLSLDAKRLGQKYYELKVWALVTAALLHKRDGREAYIFELQTAMRAVDKTQPLEMIDMAKEIIWVNFLESPVADELVRDLTMHSTSQ